MNYSELKYSSIELKRVILSELSIDRRDGSGDCRISDDNIESEGVGYVYILESNNTENVYIGGMIGSILDIMCRLLISYDYYNISGYGYNTANELLKYDDCELRIVYVDNFRSKEELNRIVNNTLKENMYICVNQKYLGGGKIRVNEKVKEQMDTKVRKIERVDKHYNILVELEGYKLKDSLSCDEIKMLKEEVRLMIDKAVLKQKVKREKELKIKFNKIKCNIGDRIRIYL